MNASFDVLAIGNAIVDVLAKVTEEQVAELGLGKGGMTLVSDEAEAAMVAESVEPEVHVSGGSAANTAVGVASFGARAAYMGKVAEDSLGRLFTTDIRTAGVTYHSNPLEGGPGSGRCLVLVTPDAERTMATYLGASSMLEVEDIDVNIVRSAKVTYLEGYLWDSAEESIRFAIDAAHAAGRVVALSLSDPFLVERHREGLRKLVDTHVDLLFANESEVKLLYETDDFDEASSRVALTGTVGALTRGASGAVVVRGRERVAVPAHATAQVVDTTGAGDLFAAGFLAALTTSAGESSKPAGSLRPMGQKVGSELLAKADLHKCAATGALAASEIISHMGSRPLISLRKLLNEESSRL